MKISDLKHEIVNGDLTATFKIGGNEKRITLSPFDVRVLSKPHFNTMDAYLKFLIKKEFPKCEF